jgi:transglutaminase-like putative cysteine protease
MKFKIVHKTVYRFSSEVFFEPHFLRFKPKNTPFIRVEKFNLNIVPESAGLSEQVDSENNFVHFCWFEGMKNEMTINMDMVVDSMEFNPFNFILYPEQYFNVPFTYSESLTEILRPSLKVSAISNYLIEYGKKILHESGSDTLGFLANLTRNIHSDFMLEYRHFGEPHSPEKTFQQKHGSCRDLAWMQVQLLRHLGIAARFVSGYYYIQMEKPEFELHAWIEVFLPGAGWIGFDPSHGIVAGNTHIPVASSSHFENTMPVSGSVRGKATSDLITNLFIEVIE